MPLHGKDGVIYFWQQRAKDIKHMLMEKDMVLAIIRGDIPALKRIYYQAQKREHRILKAETKNSKYGRLLEAIATKNRSKAEVHEFRHRLDLSLSEVPGRDVDQFVTDAIVTVQAAVEAATEAVGNSEAVDRIVAHKRREAAMSSLLEMSM